MQYTFSTQLFGVGDSGGGHASFGKRCPCFWRNHRHSICFLLLAKVGRVSSQFCQV